MDTGDHFEDIISYEEWLDDGLRNSDPAVLDLIDAIGVPLLEKDTITLICDSCPTTGWYRTCHGHMIKRYVNQALEAYAKENS